MERALKTSHETWAGSFIESVSLQQVALALPRVQNATKQTTSHRE